MSESAFGHRGRVVLVSGSTRGLGRAIAEGYARDGAKVVVHGRSEASVAEVVAALRGHGGEVAGVAADLSTPGGSEHLARAALEAFGRVDVLVNNAGASEPRPFLAADDAYLARILDVNLLSAMRLTRALGAGMVERKDGVVVFLGSVLGRTALAGNASYLVTKAAVEQLARALAVEWARHGVRVNCLAPGFFETDIVPETRHEGPVRDAVLRRTPMRRMGAPHELVDAALFLTSPRSSFVTGTTLHVDGGWLAG